MVGIGLSFCSGSGSSVNLIKTPSDFFTVFLIGITTGLVYALVALGYTLVYGILQLINFAHGDVFAFTGLVASTMILPSSGSTRRLGARDHLRAARDTR